MDFDLGAQTEVTRGSLRLIGCENLLQKSHRPTYPPSFNPLSHYDHLMSWVDTLTSTPLLVAGILGISVAIIANRRNPAQPQLKEQVKEVTQAAAHSDSPKAKMAQSVSTQLWHN
jgi:hypothetical protein